MRGLVLLGLTVGLLLHVAIAAAQPLASPSCPSAFLNSEVKKIADLSAGRVASQAWSYRVDEAISILSSQLRNEIRLHPPSIGLTAANAQLDQLDRKMIALCWPNFETALVRVEAAESLSKRIPSGNHEQRVSTGSAASNEFREAQARMAARAQQQREEDELAIDSSSPRNRAITADAQRQYAERMESERQQRDWLAREKRQDAGAIIAQNGDAKRERPGYGKGALKVYDQLFVGIVECNKRGWGFTDTDLAEFKEVGAERFGHIEQDTRDRVWTEVNSDTERKDGSKAECDQFRVYLRTYLPLLMPGTPPMFQPAQRPAQKAPF